MRKVVKTILIVYLLILSSACSKQVVYKDIPSGSRVIKQEVITEWMNKSILLKIERDQCLEREKALREKGN